MILSNLGGPDPHGVRGAARALGPQRHGADLRPIAAQGVGVGHSGDSGLVRTIVTRLLQKLRDNADQPLYIFTEPRVGYRMPRGETE